LSSSDVITTRIITQRTDSFEYNVADRHRDYSTDAEVSTRDIIVAPQNHHNRTATSLDAVKQQEPLGAIDMGMIIYREEGLAAFFIGWQARVGYWAPAISIFLTCYCSVRQAGVKYDIFG